MNKIIGIGILLMGCMHLSLAQPPIFKNSREAYSYWAQRAVIELPYAFMQDYCEVKTCTEKEKTGKMSYHKDIVEKFDSLYKSYTPDNNTILKVAKNFLKDPANHWSKTGHGRVFVKLQEKFKEEPEDLTSLFEINYRTDDGVKKPITYIAKSRSDTTDVNKKKLWDAVKERITEGYNRSLWIIQFNAKKAAADTLYSALYKNDILRADITKDSTTALKEVLNAYTNLENILESELDDVNKKIDRIKKDLEELKKRSFPLIPILLGLIFLVLLLGVVSWRIAKKIPLESWGQRLFSTLKKVLKDEEKIQRLENEKKVLKDEKKNSEKKIKHLENENKELKRENKDLTNENKALRDEVNDLKRILKKDESGAKQESLEDSSSTEGNDTKKSNSSSKPSAKKRSIRYFSVPDEEGRFLMANGAASNNGKKFYKIAYKAASTTGELSYVSGKSDGRAINQLEGYLKPVCDIAYITDRANAKSIQMTRSGTVQRSTTDSDCWQIDPARKVKIQLR